MIFMENLENKEEIASNLEIVKQGLECAKEMNSKEEQKHLLEAINKKLTIIIKLLEKNNKYQ